MNEHKGYYKDDLKIFRSRIERPIYRPFSHSISHYRMFVMLKGKAYVSYNSKMNILLDNQMLFTDCRAYYGYTFEENVPADFLEIGIHPSVLNDAYDDDEFLRALNNTPDDKRIIDLDADRFHAMRENVFGIIKSINLDAGRAHILPRLFSIISELDFYYDDISQKHEKVFKDNLPITVIEYVKHHYTEKITYKTIGERFFISKSTIIKIFRAYSGCTLHEYVTNLRLEAAIDLIRDNINIVTAAKMSGFDYYSTFLRAYKMKYGTLPMENQNKQHKYPML